MYLVSTELFVMYDFDRQSKRLHILLSIYYCTQIRARDIYDWQAVRQAEGGYGICDILKRSMRLSTQAVMNCQVIWRANVNR